MAITFKQALQQRLEGNPIKRSKVKSEPLFEGVEKDLKLLMIKKAAQSVIHQHRDELLALASK